MAQSFGEAAAATSGWAVVVSPIVALASVLVGSYAAAPGFFWRRLHMGPLDLLLLVVAWAHVAFCPFTKVEESFNVQAAHDLLVYGPLQLEKFDHFQFPGVVPRTFLGAIATAVVAAPFHFLSGAMGAPKLWSLAFVRASLAFLVWLPMTQLARALSSHYRDPRVRQGFLLVCVAQFHLPFYSSRPLPNIFGLILVLWAYVLWVKRSFSGTVRLLAAATLIFRCDTLILAAPIGLSILARRQLSFVEFLFSAVSGAALSVAATVLVDSYFWSRTIWPEFEVFWFNVILNKSSDYGVSAWHWYLSSALPRMLLGTAVFLVAALMLPVSVWRKLGGALPTGRSNDLVEKQVKDLSWELVLPMAVFVGMYSLLPHKELRFILYAVPALNAASAVAVSQAWTAAERRIASSGASRVFGVVIALAVAGLLIVSCAACGIFLRAATLNYPGGFASLRLQRLLEQTAVQKATSPSGFFVHVDNLAAQSGFSRFSELHTVGPNSLPVCACRLMRLSKSLFFALLLSLEMRGS
eukprot:INCI15074.1.p1 GENE.INCI15074.1~~INCI15074.1.p1  ORF type:complete len:524 (+),score=83.80 INCI15074.1:374-1945(+)